MSRKKTNFTPEFKTKLVLEVLKNEKTLNEIASSYNIPPMSTYLSPEKFNFRRQKC